MNNYTCNGELNKLTKSIHQWAKSKGWVFDWDSVGEKLMLIVTELAEAMEAYRKLNYVGFGDPIDDDVYQNFCEELADTIIRILNMAGNLDINIEKHIEKKMQINEKRGWKHGKNC